MYSTPKSHAASSLTIEEEPKIYWVVLRAPSDSEQDKQVGDDTLAREPMKTEEGTGQAQDLMTNRDAQELLEALAHSKQEEIPQLSWNSYVKFLLQREKLVLEREKLVLEENAHLKEEIAAEREVTRFLQGELQRSQQLVSEVLQMTSQKEDKVRDVEEDIAEIVFYNTMLIQNTHLIIHCHH